MYYWRKINIILIVLLLLFLIPSVYALLLPGFFVTDDGAWMIIRLSSFFDSLKDGQIPVRFLERLNNGYGYPVANFLYPGFMYLGSVIHILGFGFVDSVKILLIGSMLLSGFFTYFWLKKIFDPISAFIGSLFFVYTPYHLYDLYARGSVGEILAFAWVPLVLWNIERKSLPLSAIGVFLLVISHNSIALLCLPLILIYGILQKKTLVTLFSLVLGIAMSSFFIIPAIVELGLTNFGSIEISNALEYFADISLIGYATIAVLIFVLLVVILKRDAVRLVPYKGLIILFTTCAVLSVFMSAALSSFIWSIIPASFIQFPFRILSLLTISVAFLSAFVASKIDGKAKIPMLSILLILLIFSAYQYILPKERTNLPDEFYSTNMDTTTVKDEYMPKWVKEKPQKIYEKKVEVINGNAVISDLKYNSKSVTFKYEATDNPVFKINTIYYPGWKAYVDNEKVDIVYDNENGVMVIPASKFRSSIKLYFEETLMRTVANGISIMAFIGLLFIILRPILKFK